MEIKVNSIYRYGNILARVADVNGNRVTLVTGAVCDKNELAPALPVGTHITLNGRGIVLKEGIDVVDDDTEINGTKFLIEGSCFALRSYPDEGTITNSLYKMVSSFFNETHYQATDFALTKILGEWERNKERLAKLLRLSPSWNEDSLGLVWEIDIPDSQKRKEAEQIHEKIITTYADEFYRDYRRSYHFDFSDFLNINEERNKRFKAFGYKIARGMRPARALRRYYETIGANRIDDFEKLYAELSDALSDRKLKRKIVLSIHPMDFLRMSYGNSWHSCHHIGERGCFSAGTLSYLMDESSMVCTLLDAKNEEETFLQPKINRMMFFLNEKGDILQSRLYPQTRIPELEEILAKEVSAKIQEILKIEGIYKAVVSDENCDNYVWSIGSHYHDYACCGFGQNIWSVKERPNRFKIGHAGICVTCGKQNDHTDTLKCDTCSTYNLPTVRQELYYVCPNSGQKFYDKSQGVLNPADGKYYLEYYTCPECGTIHFDKNEVYCSDCRKDHKMICGCGNEEVYIVYKGKAYCEECAERELAYCETCGSVHYKSEIHEIGDRLLCNDCIHEDDSVFLCADCGEYHEIEDSYYIEGVGRICSGCYEYGDYGYCEHCGSYYRTDDLTYIDGQDVCADCRDEYYTYCEHCEEYYRNEDTVEVNGRYYCIDCANELFTECAYCGDYVDNDDITRVDGDDLCPHCFERHAAICNRCGEAHYLEHMENIDGDYYCEDCVDEIKAELEAVAEFRKGVLIKGVDTRFPEGADITILGESDDEYRIGLAEGGQLPYRYVPKSFITINESESA